MNVMPDVRWHANQIVPPSAADTVLPLATVRDDHLRVVNGTADDSYITTLIHTAEAYGQRLSWRSFRQQMWRMVVDRLPADGIVVLTQPPVVAIEAITVDDVAVDPLEVTTDFPTGPYAGFGRVSFDAVPSGRMVIDYTTGYVVGSPPGTVPMDLQQAMLLLIGELFRTRSLSVQGTVQFPAILQADRIFTSYRPY